MPIRLLCLIFLCAAALPAEAQLARLTINVSGLEPPTGKVEVSLFANAEDFMREPVLQQTQETGGQSELRFEMAGLTEGRYGLVVVHDENDNGVYDAGFLGFGAEGLGYSNNARPWIGRPSFEAVSFEIGTADLEILISVE